MNETMEDKQVTVSFWKDIFSSLNFEEVLLKINSVELDLEGLKPTIATLVRNKLDTTANQRAIQILNAKLSALRSLEFEKSRA